MPFAPSQWLSGISPFAIPVEVESTITEDPGQPALVENVSEDPNLIALRFYIPRGDDGADGAPGAPGTAASIAIGTVSALPYGSAPTVTNSGTSSAAVLDWQLVTGPQGPPGSSSNILEYQFQTATTTPPTAGHIRIDNVNPSLSNSMYVSHIDGNGVDQDYILQLVPPSATLVLQKKGDSSVSYTYNVIVALAMTGYVRFETTFVSSSGTIANNDQVILIIINNGSPGEAATVNVGTVTQVAYPGPITVTNSGTTSAALLDFQLCSGPEGPTGPAGAPGTSATIAVQSTTTGAPGTSASVVNIGTSSAAQLAFTIPRGDVGATGPAGPQGDPGTNGTSATITVGTVTTGSPGSSVTVSNSGTSSAAVFDFSIPQGATGSGSSITINNVTNSVAYRLLFTNATSGTAATALNTIASALTYNPSTLALTNTGGSISCSSVTATNFTGLASSATAITTTATTTLSDRYICFTNTVGASASVNVCSAISNQLLFNAGSTTLTVGNGTAGVGIITTNTLNAATVNGNATSATAVAVTSTTVSSARYLMFTSSTTGNAAVQVSSALANQIYVTPATPNLMIGNGTTGTGSVTCNTVSCTTMNGQASAADQVGIIATTTNSTRYLLFTPSNNSTVANASVQSAVALTYNPGTTTLTATNLTVSGTLTGTVSSATTATNIAGGSAGSIPYQTAVNVTALLAAGTAGTQLRSTGTSSAPAWSTPGGFCVTYCGTVTATTQLLCYGLPYALIGSATLNTTLGSSQSIFVTPYSGIIVAASGFNTTSSATATATVHVNGSATALLTIAAGQFTATAARSLTLSSTTQTVSAGQTIEVRINTAVTGSTQITLYIA